MSKRLTITTLVENTVDIGGLQAEHGLSLLLQTDAWKILFDTGQSDLVMRNAKRLGIDLAGLDAIVLSHGHYDHTGGLASIRKAAPQARVFLHPAALGPKYKRAPDGSSRYVGMPAPSLSALPKSEFDLRPDPRNEAGVPTNDNRQSTTARSGAGTATVAWTKSACEILDGIWVTGKTPRRTAFEDTGGSFFLDAACTQPDPLEDDQALFFDTPAGAVVVLGCGHAGVVNTLTHVRSLLQRRPVFAVLGGMHLLNASTLRIKRTLEAFRRLQVRQILPAHCTGISAAVRLWTAFPQRCSLCPVGTSVHFER